MNQVRPTYASPRANTSKAVTDNEGRTNLTDNAVRQITQSPTAHQINVDAGSKNDMLAIENWRTWLLESEILHYKCETPVILAEHNLNIQKLKSVKYEDLVTAGVPLGDALSIIDATTTANSTLDNGDPPKVEHNRPIFAFIYLINQAGIIIVTYVKSR